MIQRFRKFLTGNNLVKEGDKILLAVSGGIDSMVMTHLFMESMHEIGIAHCNFSLRSAESDKDEELVSEFASEHNIPFFSRRFETKTYAREKGISVQMAARELRYTWFEEIRNENGYDSVAVAHNLNDNIETLMINLIRGTGIAGLRGMKPSANNIIRPLLFATRGEIIQYCSCRGITFREDKSNADTKYLRNKIRHQIIPLLREINPSIESTLSETAEILTDSYEIISDYIKVVLAKVSEQKREYITFNISLLHPYIHNRALLFELFRPYGIAEVSLNDLINIINGKTGGQLFTGSYRIIKNRKELLVSLQKDVDEAKKLINNPGDFASVPAIESVRTVTITSGFTVSAGQHEVCIDSDKLAYPLILRKWGIGDYFYPLGLNHRKKLSDYFVDNKYSRIDKDNALILESGGKIVCILGDRIDSRFRITDTSVNALIIKTCQRGDPENTNF